MRCFMQGIKLQAGIERYIMWRMKLNPGDEQITFRIKKTLKEKLERAARKEGLPLSILLRKMVEDWLKTKD